MKSVYVKNSIYQQIYEIVSKIPEGKVASYGQIASILDRCTPRMVGYAMAALPSGSDVPWHRVINSQGKISPRAGGDGENIQRLLLETEGIKFDSTGSVNFLKVGWAGMKFKNKAEYSKEFKQK